MKKTGEIKVLRKLSIILCFGIMISFLSCEKKDDIENKVPGPLSNVSVKNIPGGAEVFYTVPQKNDIISIIVEFDGDGKKLSFGVTDNPNSLTLTNLPTDKRMLKLFTVNSLGKSSKSVEIEIEPLEKELEVPESLRNVTVENIPGGAKISYEIPKDNDIVKVIAEFTTSDGEEVLEFDAERNPKSLTLTIFSTDKIVIKLYTVNSLGTKSVSVDVDIKPLDFIPEALSNVTAENSPGGAKISYKIPKDNDIVKVIAEFTTSDGNKMLEFDAESNPDFLLLTGLLQGKVLIKLYTATSKDIRSEGVEIQIDPLELDPAYLNGILNSIEVEAVLRGVSISFSNNEKKEEIYFNLSYKNNKGQWIDRPNVISSDEISGTVVILEESFSEFKLFLSDEYLQNSSIREFTITPIISTPDQVIKLDKTKFSDGRLPGDASFSGGYPFEFLWNNDTTTFSTYKTDIRALPHSYTIDLGVDYMKLTRIHIHYYNKWPIYTYNFNDPKVYEIYGSNNPAEDGTWDSWKLLIECKKVKPSGEPLGEVTEADTAYNLLGETFQFPEPHVAYRYLRFKILETWAHKVPDVVASQLSEITPFGY